MESGHVSVPMWMNKWWENRPQLIVFNSVLLLVLCECAIAKSLSWHPYLTQHIWLEKLGGYFTALGIIIITWNGIRFQSTFIAIKF